MTEPAQAPEQRRVTMRSIRLLQNGQTATEEATDFVRVEHLDAYVADAQTRWQYVEVSDEPDAGPTGVEGTYAVPHGLDLPDAGVVYNEGADEKAARSRKKT